MLAIGRALMCSPRLLLLDEPSLGLAPRVVEQVFDLITMLRGQGVTIFLVEQNVAGALEIADRAYMMRSGQIVGPARRPRCATGPPHRRPRGALMDLFLQQTVNAVAPRRHLRAARAGPRGGVLDHGLINFAHGELADHLGLRADVLRARWSAFKALAVPLAILAAMGAAMAMERIAFRPVRNARARPCW
ncbi:MAG: hypothetical protein R3D80_20500 [Paracoccaceae bacterium]